jgi:hypothetical protein
MLSRTFSVAEVCIHTYNETHVYLLTKMCLLLTKMCLLLDKMDIFPARNNFYYDLLTLRFHPAYTFVTSTSNGRTIFSVRSTHGYILEMVR